MSIHPSTRLLVKLTTHPSNFGVDPEPLDWGNRDPKKRGPVVATVSKPGMRNAIGAHSGTYCVYRAVALAVQSAPADFRPDFTNTLPPVKIGPFESWFDTSKIASLDPWGHVPQSIFGDRLANGTLDIRPTISVTKSHLELPELQLAVKNGTLKKDGTVIVDTVGAFESSVVVTKAAVEPVWYLPEVARRFKCDEMQLRRTLYEQTGGMFPELVTRNDLKLFLPPVNGMTVYIIGTVESIPDVSKPLVVRLHDESADSDIFNADASTCRPYLIHGIVECVRAAQAGGAGLIVYNRAEGNALGEVAKFLVHNARKVHGDSVDTFYDQQKKVAGADDARLYELLPDVLHWLGVTQIDKFVSRSAAKVHAVESSGIRIVEVTGLPERFVPRAATVESAARSPLAGPVKLSPKRAMLDSAGLPAKRPHLPDSLGEVGAPPPPLELNRRRIDLKRRVVLTTHPLQYGSRPAQIVWGAPSPQARGPVIATLVRPELRNAIGTHNGPYAIYRAVAAAKGAFETTKRSDLAFTAPPVKIGPYPSWYDPSKIASIDPWGHLAGFQDGPGAAMAAAGAEIQPTIAITEATLRMPEIIDAMKKGRLKADGKILQEDGTLSVVKCAIDPVWFLPGIAERFKLEEAKLRQNLFEQTGGMFPELVTRNDLKVFLPPIGGCTCYIIGDPASLPDTSIRLCVRVHDECNGSDVFGSDICTCRPYLIHGIEECVKEAQEGGAGLIVYNRKEGRALGEVTKFMVYNARKRQEGGDTAANYFKRTEMIAGVQDMRFQELMPDPLHWLGVTRIDKFISMSDMKYDAIVEIDAKVYAGYYAGSKEVKTMEQLAFTVGRVNESWRAAEPVSSAPPSHE